MKRLGQQKVGPFILQTNWQQASIIVSSSYDPWYNLAVEEMLLHGTQQTDTILYLWQNENTVVIGRNQNAWKECRWKLLHQEGGKLARRLSGGGAVFHDLGNLNFTFIAPRKKYDLDKQLEVILQAVAGLGIPAEFSGRNDILASGRKFSGNAFYKDGDRAYHHGTILVAVDFARLGRYLQVSREKMAAKGIDSVQARVVNLKELKPGLDVNLVGEALKASFRALYHAQGEEVVIEGFNEKLRDLCSKYTSWEWRFGETPAFDLTFEERFPWGGIELALSLRQGHILKAWVYSDAMEPHLIESIGPRLQGLPLKKEAILAALAELGYLAEEKAIMQDIIQWLSRRDL